jgi:two-component sensor histidine kinase
MSGDIIPIEEQQRMIAVKRYDILDTPPDGSFDRITAIAARRFNAPISIISIVDHDRIWFKSHHGVDVAQIGRDPGLCASAILSANPHILTDARIDPRSLANPLVAGDFGLRFYAGVPLRTSDGHNLGTLCVLDKRPRDVDPGAISDLTDLAEVVMDQMELRLSARKAIDQAQLMAREIDHRVTNSLQFVSSLLRMQSTEKEISDPAGHLKAAATRVAAVARVHRHFSVEERQEVSCVLFLRRLCEDLSGILERPIHVTGDDGSVPAASIQPIGLIVNELVTNAAKHGDGKISVSFSVQGTNCQICVSDEGDGLPVDFQLDNQPGLGMKVVSALTRQLGGRVKASGNPDGKGSCFTISFANEVS